jgi:hypothetical protein
LVSGKNLVLASRASRGITRLRSGVTGLGGFTLDHHLGEVDITTDWVLVESFTRVETGGIRRVSSPGLVRVEVLCRTWDSRVPKVVDISLGGIVPKSVVVLGKKNEHVYV